jgi:hypothetical protein
MTQMADPGEGGDEEVEIPPPPNFEDEMRLLGQVANQLDEVFSSALILCSVIRDGKTYWAVVPRGNEFASEVLAHRYTHKMLGNAIEPGMAGFSV